ncbi:cob(I)yrinic acid a,c-diamide adenosyltransferase [Candidatus Nitrosocosmicus sp. SS]|jgi:cob(I)alamin adenosyltransferase|uniref:cob(I)yrinic acid a,c-diamide adenosyltransferase n=1 Tax=Candidatus Nitrosocosmicus agrestis TaxID=2563600 RepID=UPI00122E4F37|nr:cob(I)yrinic acid a,c-diamide adenosyltransferase [Candidatus Nitrosocosmicus sp. SS]KAA2280328.1 cob(I)yrinic acid a,c-diamide adenosyltransferase [Candidatus Nitrosocosmicus sp. SS]KAF0867745.1 cob(I)yrinic acid a,c-diamide adenosyltransferase [Candidatus Nitrosocosmicus sp. SS]MDR4491565.1 cob(I)yrinic acid a,c-diamide adenosyltransferase [Candidatus Nitrosocosmicus sp.]
MKIYTKTGDKGKTSLFDGTRVDKSSKRIESYGLVDEVNSQVGMLISLTEKEEKLREIKMLLLSIQDQLFLLGSDLANPSKSRNDFPRITLDEIKKIEKKIDELEANLDPLSSFILPGGTIQASQSHIVRTIIRRAELSMVYLYQKGEISEYAYIYINRLSDLFFVMARSFNKILGKPDIIWKSK